MPQEESRRALADVVALWGVGAATPEAVIRAACDALAAGLDSQALRELAGLSISSSTYEVEDALPKALEDIAIPFNPPRTAGAQVAAARVLASRLLASQVDSRELVAWMHRTFRHGENDAIEPFLQLDDEYDIIEHTGRSAEQVDQDVIVAARRLLAE